MGSVLAATLEHHMIVERFNLEVLNYLVLKELIEFCSPDCKVWKTLEALCCCIGFRQLQLLMRQSLSRVSFFV